VTPAAGTFSQGAEPVGVVHQRKDRLRKRVGCELPLEQQDARAGVGERVRVEGLMIGGGRGQRHQDARLPPGAQLGDGHRAGACDDEMRGRVRGADRIEEPADDDASRHRERRGSAKDALLLYDESPAGRAARERLAEAHRIAPAPTYQGKGRPTKKERRELQRLEEGED